MKVKIHVLLLLILTVILIIPGCSNGNQSGSTVDEPDITVEYLGGEYADQLIRDGANNITGSIAFEPVSDGSPKVSIAEKEYVFDSSNPEASYVADKNKAYIAYLPDEARTTFIGAEGTQKILPPTEFVQAVNDAYTAGIEADPDFQDSRLYEIYLMDDQILLIMEMDI